MNFCPFIKDECRNDCVFHIRKMSTTSEKLTACQLVSVLSTHYDLCDTIIKEKQEDINPRTAQ